MFLQYHRSYSRPCNFQQEPNTNKSFSRSNSLRFANFRKGITIKSSYLRLPFLSCFCANKFRLNLILSPAMQYFRSPTSMEKRDPRKHIQIRYNSPFQVQCGILEIFFKIFLLHFALTCTYHGAGNVCFSEYVTCFVSLLPPF